MSAGKPHVNVSTMSRINWLFLLVVIQLSRSTKDGTILTNQVFPPAGTWSNQQR